MKELLEIYLSFFKMGAVTFGGGYAMLPILRKEVVEKKKWLSEEKIMDYYAISQGLPGIIAVNVSTFIGYTRRKKSGAVMAALGVVSPCLIIITLLAMCMTSFQNNVYVRHALNAISVCVCALIIDSVIAMWKKGVKDVFGFLVFAIMLLAMTFTKVSPVLLVIVSAVGGVLYRSIKEKSEKSGEQK